MISTIFSYLITGFKTLSLSVTNRLPVMHSQVRVPQVCPNGDCPLVGSNSSLQNVSAESIGTFIINIAQLLTYVAIAVAVLFLVISGLQLVTDTGDGKRAEAAKKNFFSTLIGLVLVIAAYTIVQVIAQSVSGDVLSGIQF